MTLSHAELKTFGSTGYLVIPAVVAAEQITAANKRVDELIREPRAMWEIC